MKKIEAKTLDEAYAQAKEFFNCSIVDLKIEIIQQHSNGFLGLFKKSAIIIAVLDKKEQQEVQERVAIQTPVKASKVEEKKSQKNDSSDNVNTEIEEARKNQVHLDDTIMPASFVTDQDEPESADDVTSFHSESSVDDTLYEEELRAEDVVDEIRVEINALFKQICFDIDEIEVSAYDDTTILMKFNGKDAALLIGKEGYRYKALSYMFFNWINTKYKMQLRLEVAEFLKNQEEAISRYLVGVYESIERDGRAQTKVLDGVLIQIALNELRSRYPNKYVAIRSTRDGNKYIIINEYNNY